MKKKYISWRRVSTFKQSRSGLGLAAQKEIIKYFVGREGGEIIADYSECYTGKELSGCVELRKAIKHAKQENAILVIAKTDRFRNTVEALHVYEEMGEGNIMFCDLPHTDKFTLTLFFALAEREALITSIRTKQALAVKKSQGTKLGASNEKYVAAMKAKSEAEKMDIIARRAKTQNERKKNSRDTQAFIKVLRNVFPDVCKNDDPATWHGWWRINTHKENRTKILQLMRDYNDVDSSLFSGWEFSGDDRKLQIKLAGYIRGLKNSFNYEQACKIAS